MAIKDITNKYRQARKGNTDIVVVEGVHAFKHALRFGAKFVHIAIHKQSEARKVLEKFGTHAEVKYFDEHAEIIEKNIWNTLAPKPPDTGIIALAKKPFHTRSASATAFVGGTVVFIENPNSLFNVGAIIRTVAAVGVKSFAMSGRHNPWHADCVSTARGLHFALDYIELIDNKKLFELAKKGGYAMWALDTNTNNIVSDIKKVDKKILLFGTERDGLTKELCDASDIIVKLPMREGVSSLNLSASVAATLYVLQ